MWKNFLNRQIERREFIAQKTGYTWINFMLQITDQNRILFAILEGSKWLCGKISGKEK